MQTIEGNKKERALDKPKYRIKIPYHPDLKKALKTTNYFKITPDKGSKVTSPLTNTFPLRRSTKLPLQGNSTFIGLLDILKAT